jgi:autotransporter strand-loop-strand O-heptosyltransferase
MGPAYRGRSTFNALEKHVSETTRLSTQRGRTEASFAQPGALVLSGPEGILFDFNYGCRVQVPVDGWRVRMLDIDANTLVFDQPVEANVTVASRCKYYARFRLEVLDGERLVFAHDYDARGKQVIVRMGSSALGDSLAWMPIIDEFRERRQCVLFVVMPRHLQPLYRAGYPHLRLVTEDEIRDETFYATYHVGLFSPYADRDHQPTDPRISSMQDAVSHMLGLPCKERKPNLIADDTTRRIKERYVCIATQATAQCKYWNNPRGWPILIDYLKARGYRVLCIDRDKEYGNSGFVNKAPEGAEDFTGDKPLQERVNLLRHADFFIGLGSGLSWLAWAWGIPVVLISGFSHPSMEFRTPYRVINFHACNSCFNDTTTEFDPKNFAWCPRRVGKPQPFQCTAVITPEFVMRAVDRLIRDHAFDQAA